MLEIDRWAVSCVEHLSQECVKGYEAYHFHRVYSAIYNFCTVDMSAFYLDILKDRLYTAATHSHERRSAQTALWTILDTLVRLLAPVLSFTSEEVYSAMHEGLPTEDKAESVHMLLFPEIRKRPYCESLLEEWEKIRLMREPVLKALEEIRQSGAIGNSLEAKIRIRASEDNAATLLRHKDDLRYIFIVSQAEVSVDASAKDGLEVEVAKADGTKCERCWNYSPTVGDDAEFTTLCERCIPVVKEMANQKQP
jgi:isoleucyl-tRNA synthetase